MTEDDQNDLWHEVIKDVTPIRRDNNPSHEKTKRPVIKKQEQSPTAASRVVEPKIQKQGKGIDGHVAQKLRKGQMRPEAKLDLHGETQVGAQQRIVDFVLNSQARSYRLVLIVTGTGARSRLHKKPDDVYTPAPGILKRRFEEFINDSRINNIVLDYREAHKTHGGIGAYYVYLRRQEKTLNR